MTFGVPFLRPGEHVPCEDEVSLFTSAAHPTRDDLYRRIVADAKAVCAACHVTTECAAWAIERKAETGVWGGLSDKDRRTIRKQLAATARHGTSTGPRKPHVDCTRPERERAADWAAMLRDGRATVDTLAASRNVKTDTVKRILNRAGWSQTGQPRQQKVAS